METASQWSQFFGLLAILVGATFVFVRIIGLVVRRRHHALRFGFELLVFFAIVYLFATPALHLVSGDVLAPAVTKGAAFLWWISLAYTVNNCLKRFFWEGFLSVDGERRIPKLMTDGIALLVYAAAVGIVLHYVYDESITAILATSGAAVFVVGLSAQSTLKEVFSGIALNATKTLRLGDFVKIDGVYGRVNEINWRSVSLLSPHTRSLHIFPNSAVAEKTVLNYSEPTELFGDWVTFKVEASASPDLVINTITEELEHSRYIVRDPKPAFNVRGFSDMGLEYRVLYYFEGNDPWWDAQNEMCMAIWSALRRKGIRLSLDRHNLQCGDENAQNPWLFEEAAEPQRDPLQILRRFEVFSSMSEETLAQVGQTARQYDYTPPDCVYQQGDRLNSVYCVVEGHFAALEPEPDGSEAEVERYHAGELFGLEGLIGSNEADFRMQCMRYGVLYTFDASGIRELLSANPEMSEALRSYLEQHRSIQNSNRKAHGESQAHQQHHKYRAEINLHLRKHLEDIFSKPLLHRILHALSTRSRQHDLLESMMAACALIAAVRGDVDDAERAFLRQQLASIELFRHMPAATAIAHFEDYATKIFSDSVSGNAAAMAQLAKVAGERHLAKVVLATAYGMSGVHEHTLSAEKEVLEDIAKRLQLPADAAAFIGAMKVRQK